MVAFWRSFLFTSLILTRVYSLEESLFHKGSICYVQERFTRGCSREYPQSGFSSCLDECSRHISCQGVSTEKNTGKCFIHDVCRSIRVCDTPDIQHTYYSKYCVHGYWNHESHMCDCVFGTHGQRCDRAFKDCQEAQAAGAIDDGMNIVLIDPRQDGNVYKIRCFVSGSYMNIRVMSNKGNLNVNRTWNEYVRGFQLDDEHNNWIGLSTWHVLSTYAHCNTLYAPLEFVSDPSGKRNNVYRIYYGFVVGSEAEKFPITFSSSEYYTRGTAPGSSFAGDCFQSVQNTAFSTWDKDNDGNALINCASLVESGWWHPRSCDNPCNFMSWGLEDWSDMPSQQRFSMLGVDMSLAAPWIKDFHMYLTC